jgi:DEAD/DEAH box helicase domain-containing protein
LHEDLKKALVSKGIKSLYSHQLEALKCASGGKDLIITTPTSSGKSLCFNIPVRLHFLHRLTPQVFDFLLKNRSSTAIFLFPLNALAIDQQEKIEGLNRALPREVRLNLAIITGTKRRLAGVEGAEGNRNL